MSYVLYERARHAAAVTALFHCIYPEWRNEDLIRIAYDERHPLHVRTILALDADQIIGQANAFRISAGSEVVNLGYHLHPDFRRRGHARSLVQSLMDATRNCSAWVIQTSRANVASCAVAQTLGFALISTNDIPIEQRANYKFTALPDGICFRRASLGAIHSG